MKAGLKRNLIDLYNVAVCLIVAGVSAAKFESVIASNNQSELNLQIAILTLYAVYFFFYTSLPTVLRKSSVTAVEKAEAGAKLAIPIVVWLATGLAGGWS